MTVGAAEKWSHGKLAGRAINRLCPWKQSPARDQGMLSAFRMGQSATVQGPRPIMVLFHPWIMSIPLPMGVPYATCTYPFYLLIKM